MLNTLNHIIERTYAQLEGLANAYLPGIAAGLIVLAASLLAAAVVRRILRRVINTDGWDRFLCQAGVTDILTRSGRICVARVISGAVYWVIVALGLLLAAGALDFGLTARLFNALVSLLPRFLVVGAIILAGVWLARYLGRGTLVWACNEGLPYPRRLAATVRVLITFTTVVIAAEHIDFARAVLVPAFLMAFGGLVLSISIAVGIGAQRALRERLTEAAASDREECSSLWNHV